MHGQGLMLNDNDCCSFSEKTDEDDDS